MQNVIVQPQPGQPGFFFFYMYQPRLRIFIFPVHSSGHPKFMTSLLGSKTHDVISWMMSLVGTVFDTFLCKKFKVPSSTVFFFSKAHRLPKIMAKNLMFSEKELCTHIRKIRVALGKSTMYPAKDPTGVLTLDCPSSLLWPPLGCWPVTASSDPWRGTDPWLSKQTPGPPQMSILDCQSNLDPQWCRTLAAEAASWTPAGMPNLECQSIHLDSYWGAHCWLPKHITRSPA